MRFRIPRTKQEIEADFVRRKIATKFCKQLRLLSDTEMDNMDLLKGINYNYSLLIIYILILQLKCVAIKRLQAELETETINNVIVEESDEVISSTKTTSPSLKKSPKSSDFGKNICNICVLTMFSFN